EGFARRAREARVTTYGKLNSRYETGNHVHVESAPLEGVPGARTRLVRLFARYEDHLARVSAGHMKVTRSYNRGESSQLRESRLLSRRQRDYGYYYGSYLSRRDHTYEFRLWNSTITE